MVLMIPLTEQQRYTDIKNRLLKSVGEGEGWMIERIALKYIH